MTCLKRLNLLGKEGEAEGVTSTQRPLEHSEPDKEVRAMSRWDEYSDSARFYNVEQSENWQSISELAAKLVRK